MKDKRKIKPCGTKSCKVKIESTRHYCNTCAQERIKESRRKVQQSPAYKAHQSKMAKKPKEEPKTRLDRKSFWDYKWCNSMNGSAYDF